MLSDVTKVIPPAVLGTYYSADWGVDVNDALDAMDSAWTYYLRTGKGWWNSGIHWGQGYEPHPAEIQWGGPAAYIEHLCTVLESLGSFHTPLTCNRFGPSGLPILHNGNHRAIASLLTGIPIHVNLYS